MKVFCCKNRMSFGGGLILVAANTKEEAYLTAAYDDKTSYLFEWADDDYMCGNVEILASWLPNFVDLVKEYYELKLKNEITWKN